MMRSKALLYLFFYSLTGNSLKISETQPLQASPLQNNPTGPFIHFANENKTGQKTEQQPRSDRCQILLGDYKLINKWWQNDEAIKRSLCVPGKKGNYTKRGENVKIPFISGTVFAETITLDSAGQLPANGPGSRVRNAWESAPSITGSFAFVSPTVYLAFNSLVASRTKGSETVIEHSSTVIPILPRPTAVIRMPRAAVIDSRSSLLVEHDDEGGNLAYIDRKWGDLWVEFKQNSERLPANQGWNLSADPWANNSRTELELLEYFKKKQNSNATTHRICSWDSFEIESLSERVLGCLWGSVEEEGLVSPEQLWKASTDFRNWFREGTHNGISSIPCDEPMHNDVSSPSASELAFNIPMCQCMGDKHPTKKRVCHYCMKHDYRWTYDLVDKSQVKRWIKEYDPSLADCDIDDHLGDTKIPRMLVRSDSQWLDIPVSPEESTRQNEGNSGEQDHRDDKTPEGNKNGHAAQGNQENQPGVQTPAQLAPEISPFPYSYGDGKPPGAQTIPPFAPRITPPPLSPGTNFIHPIKSAVVPLASGDMTIIQDPSSAGEVTIQLKGLTTVVSGPEATIAGHKLHFVDGNVVNVDGQFSIRLQPALSTAIVPLGQDFVTVLSDSSSPGKKTIIFQGSRTIVDGPLATIEGHRFSLDHEGEVVVDASSTVKFQPGFRTANDGGDGNESRAHATNKAAVIQSSWARKILNNMYLVILMTVVSVLLSSLTLL